MATDRKNKVVSVQDSHTQITREKILTAAMELVEEHGMNYLTVRNVCDKAGLSTGSFYNLFTGKDELISYYLKHSFSNYKQKAQEEAAGYNSIEKCLLVYRLYVKCCEEAGLEFVSGLYAANNSPFFDFIHRDSEDELVLDVIRAYLAEGQEEGDIRKDIDMDEALLRIAALVTGSLFYWCVFKGQMDVAYETDEALRTYLLSLAVDPTMEMTLPRLKKEGTFLESIEG